MEHKLMMESDLLQVTGRTWLRFMAERAAWDSTLYVVAQERPEGIIRVGYLTEAEGLPQTIGYIDYLPRDRQADHYIFRCYFLRGTIGETEHDHRTARNGQNDDDLEGGQEAR